jgi:ABC-type transport system involved in multi-copper enzyme maturation permease subunit
MLLKIAAFELRYQLRSPILWIAAACIFLLAFASMSLDLIDDGGTYVNSAYATLQKYVAFSLFFMFVAAAFVANVVVRDDETGFGPILRATAIAKTEYLVGRFLGAFAVAALCLALIPPAMLLGSLMPWVDPATIGPHSPGAHLFGYFVLGLPNVFICSAILFSLAAMTRSMMGTYLGLLAIFILYAVLDGASNGRADLAAAVGMAEPFAKRALEDAARSWTATERDMLLPPLAGTLLWNRLLWTGLAILFLAAACARYRFADKGAASAPKPTDAETAPRSAAKLVLPNPQHGPAAARALLWARTRFEMRQVFASPAFAVLIAFGLFTVLLTLLTQRDPDGRPTYPTTVSMIPELEGGLFLIPTIIVIIYAGELVWSERTRRIHEIVDATPLPNWAYVVPKTTAVALILLSIFVSAVAASVLVQLSLGYTRVELGEYLLWYILPATCDMLLLAVLAVFVQALAPHKIIGWGVMILLVAPGQLGLAPEHNLLNYGGSPKVPLTDLNGAGAGWKAAWLFRLYWGAFAVLLLVAAHLLWRRGTETRLRPRLKRARRCLTGAPGRVAAAAFFTFAATGAYAYYNTNVLNTYRSQDAEEAHWAEYERRYLRYAGLPQPTVSDIRLEVALYPEERRAVTDGRYRLSNLTGAPIAQVHIRMPDEAVELLDARVEGGRLLSNDATYTYRIFALDRPMQPGEARALTFRTRRWQRGIRGDGADLRMIENGTFLSANEFLPAIGMSSFVPLSDPAARRRQGLGPAPRPALPKDLAAAARPGIGSGWASADILVSTSADQVPLAPGRKVFDMTRGGRRIARFRSEAPVLGSLAILSGRYAERRRAYRGRELAVYHHPAHAWNADRMLGAMEASLEYYREAYGPYPFGDARMVEFPGYLYAAQAFPGTVAFSETLGFVADYRDPATADHVTYVTAHELAHHYWGHQVAGADVQGEAVVVETLATYSALMVMRRVYGPERLRAQLADLRDGYLAGRSGDPAGEVPLVRAKGSQSYIHSNKGPLALYLLQERLGEAAVNRALRRFLERFRFRQAPFARSIDLVAELRKEARTPEQQALITDLFERVTRFDYRV